MRQEHRWPVIILAVVVTAHIFLAPFNKVEESFNVQGVHDLVFHKFNVGSYDHQEYPGVVPRTFLGAIPIAIISLPAVRIAMDLFGFTKIVGLYIGRICLGLVSVWSFSRVASALERHLGPAVGNSFLLITACQFHLPFYMSRFLPNTFALILCNLSIGHWMARGRPETVVSLLVVSATCFRCDSVLLLICICLHLLGSRQLSLGQLIIVGMISGTLSIATTVFIDSWFWGRWLWPEWEVFHFNGVAQKSHMWGVMPFAWYWNSALPRALLCAYPMALVGGFGERRVRPVIMVALVYVLLYSNLGHKEVRFLFPVLPLFNVSAASFLARIFINRTKSTARFVYFLIAMLSIGVMVGASGGMLWASMSNYPGGAALQKLHELEGFSSIFSQEPQKNSTGFSVHVDTLPAMTGVSRFGELDYPWRYSKVEGISSKSLSASFTHLLSTKQHVPGFDKLAAIQGFEGFRFKKSKNSILGSIFGGELPIEIAKTDKVFIMKRKRQNAYGKNKNDNK